ncbi:hypothetical protein E2C01_006625 [Portunus trituberculatus]|uniref:Uncharacterized protein n=1 Tax=Portunus trituberculatus TaxID=210409 RepID=A0A5B7D010_PORTR|nr:hypothetical protein [Portunus trituberculatus]
MLCGLRSRCEVFKNMTQNDLVHSSPRRQQLEALREVGAGRYRQERKGVTLFVSPVNQMA